MTMVGRRTTERGRDRVAVTPCYPTLINRAVVWPHRHLCKWTGYWPGIHHWY